MLFSLHNVVPLVVQLEQLAANLTMLAVQTAATLPFLHACWLAAVDSSTKMGYIEGGQVELTIWMSITI